jgi:hypothetical protein
VTYRAIDPAAAWGYSEHLLAGILNQLAAIRYMLGGGKGMKPKPVEPPRKKPSIKRIDLGAYLTRLRNMQRPVEEVPNG